MIVTELIEGLNCFVLATVPGAIIEMKQLNIVIAEDSKQLACLLLRTLSAIDEFKVVGIASDGAEAVRLVKELRPDVLVLDLKMPVKNGEEALQEIRTEDTTTVIVVFTDDPSPRNWKVSIDGGANYFLNKSQITELIEICHIELLAS